MAGRRVLVVDDESMIAMVVCAMLEDLGCEVVGPAMDFDAAMALAQTAEFDWAILDLNLNGRTTLPVADILRRRQIPFAFASGHAAGHLGDQFADVAWLEKPFVQEEIAAILGLDMPSGPA
jgi:CheY-like chemotaxis protein